MYIPVVLHVSICYLLCTGEGMSLLDRKPVLTGDAGNIDRCSGTLIKRVSKAVALIKAREKDEFHAGLGKTCFPE